MVPILLIAAALTQAAGAPPTDWKPLTGVTGVHYRWSRPTSNSCMVEFESAAASQELQFKVTASVASTNPPASLEYNPDSPMHVESTKIKPQVGDRVFSMRLARLGRDTKDIHDCYGVVGIRAATGPQSPGTTSQPFSQAKPGGTN
jgi:hypothetical protein